MVYLWTEVQAVIRSPRGLAGMNHLDAANSF